MIRCMRGVDDASNVQHTQDKKKLKESNYLPGEKGVPHIEDTQEDVKRDCGDKSRSVINTIHPASARFPNAHLRPV